MLLGVLDTYALQRSRCEITQILGQQQTIPSIEWGFNPGSNLLFLPPVKQDTDFTGVLDLVHTQEQGREGLPSLYKAPQMLQITRAHLPLWVKTIQPIRARNDWSMLGSIDN